MPELPELEVVREVVGPRLRGRTIADAVVSPRLGFLLRTPPLGFVDAVRGRRVTDLRRRGKFMVIDLEPRDADGGLCLVVNPMLGGRFAWSSQAEKVPAAMVFRLVLDGGDELRYTDTARMGRVYLEPPSALGTVPGWSELGPDALEIDAETFAKRIRRHPGELKRLLRNQEFVAGVGNAYSDEVLWHARLLPLRRRSTLSAEDVARLHESMQTVLREAVATIRAQPAYLPHKQDRSFMAVHGRGGQDCPRCGHRISEITSGGEATDFCRGCQH